MSVDRKRHEAVQGWLTVSYDCNELAEWKKVYCVLSREDRKLFFYSDEEAALAKSTISPSNKLSADLTDGSQMSAMKRGGNSGSFSTLNSGEFPSQSPFQRNVRGTRSFKDRVRSSLQRPKKLRQEPATSAGGDLILPGMRGGHSMDNIHRISILGGDDIKVPSLGKPGTSIDLATKGTLNIQEVHQSVSPRHSCFRVITDLDTLYCSCGSSEDLDKWVTSLNEVQWPNRNHLRRLNTLLVVSIFEARNLDRKKRYYCEIYLNDILYAQTCCKTMNDILFWGEPFVFEDLPMLGSIVIKVFKENYSKKKKERLPSTPVGKIEFPTLMLETGQVLEKWNVVQLSQAPRVAPASSKDSPAIRIKLQYQVVSILPLKAYDELLKYLKTDFASLCSVLEPVITAKTKDEIAQTLLKVLQYSGKAKEFLCDIIMAEVLQVDNENLIFRGNTFATKAVDTYMKMVGEKYLRETLQSFICELLDSDEDCEVDPTKLNPGANLSTNQQVLIKMVRKVWMDILKSWNRFPSDLRNTLYGIRQRFQTEDACFKLISGSIFLRFFCPAILSPSLFQLCQEYPGEKVARKLTLVAKVLQNLANLARFGVKEEYMCFLNEFVEQEIKNMRQYIERISSPVPDSCPVVDWGPFHIDLGRELSIMHTTLLIQIPQLKEESQACISELPGILDQITRQMKEADGDPFSSTFEALRVMQSTISQFTPNSLKVQPSSSPCSSECTTPVQSTSNSPTGDQWTIPLDPPASSPSQSRQSSAIELRSLNSSSPTHHHSSSTLPRSHHSTSSSGGSTPAGEDPHTGRNSIPPPLDLTSSLPRQLTNVPEIVTEESSPGGAAFRSAIRGLGQVDSMESKDAFIIREESLSPRTSNGGHRHSRSMDGNVSFRFDQTIHMTELTAENTALVEEIEQLKQQLEESQARASEFEKENEKLRKEAAKSDASHRKIEQELKTLRDSRVKILRGLNTQTEIAMVQFKRDFDNLKRQLQTKDELIHFQERKIRSLVEANCTLRNGLQQVAFPTPSAREDSESDEDEEDLLTNGHSTRPLSSELAKYIKQLDSGQFDI